MAQRSATSRTRARVDAYYTAALVATASAVFLSSIPFIPAAPFLPLVVALGLGAVSLRESGVASAALYLLAFFSTLWQLIGFGFFHLLSSGVGLVVIGLIILPAFILLSRRVDAVALPMALLAVGLMLTPQYYLSVPLVVVTSAVFNLATAAALSLSFVLFLAPLLLIENGLFLSVASQGSVPVAFAQLVHLAAALRPPLPNLNILISQFPPGYLYPRAEAIAAFVSADAFVIAIPLAILLVMALVSASVARLARPYLEGLKLLESEKFWRPAARLAVSVLAAVIFVAVLAVLSTPGAGGFQTSIVQSGVALAGVAGGSVVVGASFVGVDAVATRLEATELSSTKLEDILSGFKSELAHAKELLDRVSEHAPSMNLGPERKMLSESESYVKDMEMQIATATEGTTSAWIDRFNNVAYPAVLALRERLRKGVTAEVAFLSSVALISDNNLNEAKVGLRYPPIEGVPEGATLEMALAAYDRAVATINEITTRLYDLYTSATDAFDRLLGQEGIPPSVSPTSLLSSHDYATAMRLVTGEYWLDFQVKRGEEFAGRVASLKETLREVEGGLGGRERVALWTVAEAKLVDSPSQAATVLGGVVELKTLIRDVIDASIAEVETTRRLISSIDPTALSIVRLETSELSGNLQGLRGEVDSVGESFAEMQAFLKTAAPVLKTRVDSMSRDELTMIILSQYPVAARMIDSLFENRKSVNLSLLPFQSRAAAMYCKLYSAANPSLQYDEISEVLSVRDA